MSNRIVLARSKCWAPVLAFFNNDIEKAALWFRTENPLLGGVRPLVMMAAGREEKLLKFIETQLKENAS